jgi:hypothetical protein
MLSRCRNRLNYNCGFMLLLLSPQLHPHPILNLYMALYTVLAGEQPSIGDNVS